MHFSCPSQDTLVNKATLFLRQLGMHVNPVQKEAIRHTIKHKIVSFIFRYSQPVAGMPQTGATVATATSYPGTETNVPYVMAMLMYCSHHAITPAVPYTSLTFLCFLSLPPPPLSSSSPFFISSSVPIFRCRLFGCWLSDAATATSCLWCVHLPTAAGCFKLLPSQHCGIQHNHDTAHPNDHIQCYV